MYFLTRKAVFWDSLSCNPGLSVPISYLRHFPFLSDEPHSKAWKSSLLKSHGINWKNPGWANRFAHSNGKIEFVTYSCYLLSVFHTQWKLQFDNHTFNLTCPKQGLRVDHSRGILPHIHLEVAHAIWPWNIWALIVHLLDRKTPDSDKRNIYWDPPLQRHPLIKLMIL